MAAKKLGIAGIVIAGALVCWLSALSGPARGQPAPGAVPSMSLVPAAPGEVPAPSAVPTKAPPKAAPRSVRKAPAKQPTEVEPAQARLKLKEDAWVFTKPTQWSKHLTRAHADKYAWVTGSTKYYLQVKLKDGRTGYISSSAFELVKPTDKVFALTSDTPVRKEPNRFSPKIAEVHKGRQVHAVGIALNYIKIKMHSGLEGYIPLSSLE